VLTKSSLSTPQQRLLETLQKTNYGRIEGLCVRDRGSHISKRVALRSRKRFLKPIELAC
jgi:hypothetical protein